MGRANVILVFLHAINNRVNIIQWNYYFIVGKGKVILILFHCSKGKVMLVLVKY